MLLLFAATLRGVEHKSGPIVERHGADVVEGVEVSIRSVSKYSDRWEVETVTRNDSHDAVYVLTDPKQSNGESGPYIDVAENDPTTLTVSTRFFERPPYFLYINVARVKLRRLEPQSSYVEKYTLQLPLRSTVPPYGKSIAQTNRPIDQDKIKTVKAYVGVLPGDEGIREIAQRKPLKQFSDAFKEGEANGHERVARGAFKGKALADAQSIVSASYAVANEGDTTGRQL